MRNLTHQLTLLCFKANLLLHATFCFNLSVKQHWPLKKVRRLGKAGWNDNENSNKKDNLGSPLSLIFGEQVMTQPPADVHKDVKKRVPELFSGMLQRQKNDQFLCTWLKR